MNKTVFGRNKFFDEEMLTIHTEEIQNKALDTLVSEAIKVSGRYGFTVDSERLREQLLFCMKLDNIEKTELIDFAVKLRIENLSNELAEKKAELLFKEKQKSFFDKIRGEINGKQ